jgi:hypothetical protein
MMTDKVKVEIVGSVYDGTEYLKGVVELPEDQALSLIASKHAKPFYEPEELIPGESENDNPEDSKNEEPEGAEKPTPEDEELPNTDINEAVKEPEPQLSEEKDQNQQSRRFGRRNK